MGIYKNSRYEGTFLYQDEDGTTFIDPIYSPRFKPVKEDYMIEIRDGDRLDILAKELYGDETLEWVFMDANPQYSSPLDIKTGDYLNVPNPERVIGSV